MLGQLDTFIAFGAVMLAVSLFVTAVNQAVAAAIGLRAGVPGSGAGVDLGGEKRSETGPKVETGELVRKTANTFVCSGIGVE